MSSRNLNEFAMDIFLAGEMSLIPAKLNHIYRNIFFQNQWDSVQYVLSKTFIKN